MSVRKLILLILAILLAFTAWDAIHWYASPQSVNNAQTGNVQTLKGSSIADTMDLEPFQSIVYWLDAPLPKETSVVLSYTKEDYSSGKTERHFPKDTQQLAFQVPLGKYFILDCYIDANVGIEKITISDQAADGHFPYPFHATNVLIPSTILLAVLLLFIYVKPLNRFLKTIDRTVLDPETRHNSITIAYIVLTSIVLMQHVYVTIYHKYVLTAATALSIPLIVFTIISILLGRLWKDKVFWILFLLWYIKLFSTAWHINTDFYLESNVFTMAAYAFFGIYAVGRVIKKDLWKTSLSVFCALWILVAVVYAAFGLYVAISGYSVPNLGSEEFTIAEARLYYIYHPVTSGIALSTSMAVSILGYFLTKKRAIKNIYVISAIILFIAGSLTGARTAYVVSGVELAFLLCLLICDRLKFYYPQKKFITTGKWVALAILFITAAGLIAFAQSYVTDVFKIFRTRGNLFLSFAYAEGQSQLAEIAHRGFIISSDPDVTFTNRFTIWKNTLEVITSNKTNLILGQSVHTPFNIINSFRAANGLAPVSHCHNTFLQTMLENGLPGFLLYTAFFCSFIFHSVRVIRNRNICLWQRLIPLPALGCFVADLVDCTCHVTYGYPQMTLLFLFAGFTITISRQIKKDDLVS